MSSMPVCGERVRTTDVYRWFAKRLIRRMLDRQQAGDIDGLLSVYAHDVRSVFPGRSSWAADVTGKDAIKAWLRRFHRVGIQFDPKEILVSGPPWNMVVCVHFFDHVKDASGAIVYENEGVIFGKTVWGKLTYYTVYEDTQKVSELDQYLVAHERRRGDRKAAETRHGESAPCQGTGGHLWIAVRH